MTTTSGTYSHLPLLECKDVFIFILGAGFSRAVNEAMPLMKDHSQKVADRLGVDFQRVLSLFSGDLELAMTFLAQGHPWLPQAERLRKRALFLEASEAIGKELDTAVEKVLYHPCPGWLVRFVHYLHDHRCTVITLNYDTLLERAFQKVEMGQGPFGDPPSPLDPRALFPVAFESSALESRESRTAVVLKLHGSTNWLYSGRSEFFGEPLRYRRLSGWSTHDLFGVPPDLAGRFPLIVPPVADKLGYFQNEAIQHLWLRGSQALRDSQRVFLVGYSLPDTDLTIRFLLSSSTPDNGVVCLVPVSDREDINSQIEKLFPKRYQIGCRYQGERAVERMVEGLLGEELSLIAEVKKGAGGPVEQRIRSTLSEGHPLPVPGRVDQFAIERFHDSGLTVTSEPAGVRTFIKWHCLEELVPALRA
jgi:hypothetical protein